MLPTVVSGWCWRPAGFWRSFSFSWIGFNGTSKKGLDLIDSRHKSPKSKSNTSGWWIQIYVLILFYFLFISNPTRTEHLKARNGPFIHSSSLGKSECKYELLFLLSQHDDVHGVFWSFCHADKFEVIHRCVGSTWAFLFCLLVYFFPRYFIHNQVATFINLSTSGVKPNLIRLVSNQFHLEGKWHTRLCMCVILQLFS